MNTININYPTQSLKTLLFFNILLFLSNNVFGIKYPVNKLNFNNGLSHGEVYSFLEDDFGNLWIGTIDGLNKYDGDQITVYNTEDGLPNNTIRSMVEDRYHRIWLGTDKGIHIYHPLEKKFTSLQFELFDIHERINSLIIIDDYLWVGSIKGVYAINISKNLASISNIKNTYFFPINNVHELINHPDHQSVWVASNDGLISLSIKETGIKTYQRVIPSFLADSKIQSISSDAEGLFCSVYGEKYGVYYFKYGSDNINKLGAYQGVQSICSYNKGKVYLGSSINGVIEITNPLSDQSCSKVENLSSNIIQKIYKDKNNGLWLATSGAGVNYIDQFHQNFIHYAFQEITDNHDIKQNFIRALSIDEKSNKMFIGIHNGGLWSYDLKNKNIQNYGLGHQLVYDIKLDKDEMYVCGSDTLSIFKRSQSSWKKSNSIHLNSYLTSLAKSSQNVFWITSRKGLVRLERKENQWLQSVYNQNTSPSINHNNCRVVVFDSVYRELWLGMQGGGVNVLKLDAEDKITNVTSFTSKDTIALSNDFVRSIYKQNDSTYFIGTYNGLHLIHRKNEGLTISEKDKRLSKHVIQSITEDDDKNLWIGINKGLIKYSSVDLKQLVRYNNKRGLASNEFSEHTVHKTSDNKLFFGTVNGVISFSPSTIQSDSSLQEAVLCLLQDDKSEEIVGDKVTISKNELHLKLRAKSVTATKKCNFQYQLVDIDSCIKFANSTQKSIQYQSLNDGTYTFKYRISNLDGIFDDSQWQEVKVNIKTSSTYSAMNILISFISMLLIGFVIIKNRNSALAIKSKSNKDITIKKEVSLTDEDEVFLEKLYLLITEGLSDPDFSVELLEKKMGMSHANFYRKLKLLTGKTAKNVIQDFRMDEACKLLKSKNYRVSEVAYLVGFNDPKYFTKCFKKQFGKIPSQYT
ncbi:helix-turn-helix domain-containing protein [Flammeovirga sp. MY04]|uniref:two-component regulator propeller domain-containing protein n=1 Tax=Flammeovirga sp. MY04 TaxID=1191459 RepID=UPI000806137F|nr:two-component regulator propeller domain-containing protein [Flammeovirga sp. MY04]ANQ51341.1 helix-turn-helix domain-containing protein [Flammeovirga sp. MY04]